MKQWLLVLLVSVSTQALARGGEEVANGGNVVRFQSESGNQPGALWLLDFTEAIYNFRWQPVPQTMPELLAKLNALHPIKAAEIAEFDRSFFNEASIAPNIVLTDISDAKSVALPDGAKVLQAAAQHAPTLPEEPRYLISKLLWDELDDFHKQGLKTHEIIYRSAIEDGATNSVGVRALNAALYAKPIEYFQNMTDAERYQISVNVGWDSFLTHAFVAPIDEYTKFYKENGSLKCSAVPGGTKIKLSTPNGSRDVEFPTRDSKYNRMALLHKSAARSAC